MAHTLFNEVLTIVLPLVGIGYGTIYWIYPIDSKTAPPFWPYSKEYWAASMRAGTVAGYSLGLGTLAFILNWYFPRFEKAIMLSGAVVLFGGFLVVLAITLFNQPKFLRPPRYRHEEGYLRVMKRKRTAKQRRHRSANRDGSRSS